MANKRQYRWIIEEELPDGHRIFMATTSRWAIADDSGDTPDQTDDGVLWLDSARCLSIDTDESFNPPREVMSIPLIKDNGKQTRTITNAATLLTMAHRFGWMVQNDVTKETYEIN